jgi:hypothetical protein
MRHRLRMPLTKWLTNSVSDAHGHPTLDETEKALTAASLNRGTVYIRNLSENWEFFRNFDFLLSLPKIVCAFCL